MISVQAITKKFGNLKAVDDLSFEINEGEIVGLLGPNGAGKSTTMRVMSGFLAPDAGDVSVDGVSVSENPVWVKSMIGYLPENNPLYKDMLVSEILDYSLNLKNIARSDKKEMLDFAIKAVNIEHVYNKPVAILSKGFKQRVGIAIALLHRPQVLIMDEPTEGLDPNQRTEIRKLIRELSKDHTIIISTHIMQEVEALCSRMIIINKGKKVADGPVEELVQNAEGDKIVHVKLEGKDVRQKLSELKGVKESDVRESGSDNYEIVLTVEKDVHIQAEISKLAATNNWTIWEIREEKQLLEELFKKLTNS